MPTRKARPMRLRGKNQTAKLLWGCGHLTLSLLCYQVPKSEISYSRKGERRENVNDSRQDDWGVFPDAKGISGFGLDHRHASSLSISVLKSKTVLLSSEEKALICFFAWDQESETLPLISCNDQDWKVAWHRGQKKFVVWFGTRLKRWYFLSFSCLWLFHRESSIWGEKSICGRGGKLILDLTEVTIDILYGAWYFIWDTQIWD